MADTKTVDYYLNAQLKAKEPGSIYNAPNGVIDRSYDTGAIVGEIYSWVQRGDQIWWQLKEGGFVLHAPGKFDATTAEYTSQGKVDEIIDALSDPPGISFPDLPELGDMKKALIIGGAAVLGIGVFAMYLNYRGTRKLAKQLNQNI